MLLLRIFKIDLEFIQIFFGTGVAQIGNLLGLTPGGLGLVEAGWTGVLHYHAVPAAKIAAFLVSQRILILLMVLINYVGIVVLYQLHLHGFSKHEDSNRMSKEKGF